MPQLAQDLLDGAAGSRAANRHRAESDRLPLSPSPAAVRSGTAASGNDCRPSTRRAEAVAVDVGPAGRKREIGADREDGCVAAAGAYASVHCWEERDGSDTRRGGAEEIGQFGGGLRWDDEGRTDDVSRSWAACGVSYH